MQEVRPVRTAEEMLRCFYKPVRKGIRTPKQIVEIFQPITITEIRVSACDYAPFSRIVFAGKTYSDQASKMGKLVEEMYQRFPRENSGDHCDSLKRHKAKWERQNGFKS